MSQECSSVERLSPEVFLARFGRLWESIFRTEDMDLCPPFRDPAWKTVLLSGHRITPEDEILDALIDAARGVGDRCVVLTDTEPIPPHQQSVYLPLEEDKLEEVRATTWINAVGCVMFGPSASWGILFAYDDYTWVGGEDRFMTPFAQALGGERALQENFLQDIREGWFIDEDRAQRILRAVGWA